MDTFALSRQAFGVLRCDVRHATPGVPGMIEAHAHDPRRMSSPCILSRLYMYSWYISIQVGHGTRINVFDAPRTSMWHHHRSRAAVFMCAGYCKPSVVQLGIGTLARFAGIPGRTWTGFVASHDARRACLNVNSRYLVPLYHALILSHRPLYLALYVSLLSLALPFDRHSNTPVVALLLCIC